MKRSCPLFLAALFFIIHAVSCIQAYAADAGMDDFVLEEITVTAQKRSENQQKVPITMEVISSEDIRMSGKNDLEEILANVPSILLNKAADGLRVSLRGISDDTTPYAGTQTSTPVVAVNIDGVYSNRKDTGSGLFDLERVEVLYGPQSTMYASNSPGGIVNVITANPKLDTYEVSGSLEYGNYDLLHTEGVLNMPIADALALRAAFSTSVRDGYLSNGGDDEDSKAARIRGLYQPNDMVSVVVSGELSKTSNVQSSVSAFEDQDDVDDPWDNSDRLVSDNPTKAEKKKLYANMDLDFAFATVTVVPAYSESDSNGTQVRQAPGGPTGEGMLIYNDNTMSSDEKSIELRMSSSPDFAFTWIFGLNYYDSSINLDQTSYDESRTETGEGKVASMEEEARAVFANVTYPVSDSLRATAGYRMSWDDIKVMRAETMVFPGGVSEVTVRKYDHQYSDPDYKIGVEYDLSDASMIYADHSTSYRSQGLEGAGPSGPSATEFTPPSEKLKAYTIGSKNRFFNNRLQVNASAFYYDYKNYAASEQVIGWDGPDPENPTSGWQVTEPNASTWGDGTMRGIDLNTTTVITQNDVLNLSVSYLKSKWDRLFFDYYSPYRALTAAPKSMDLPITIEPLEDADYAGKPMTSSPEWSINASYRHTFNLANGANIEARVEACYKGDYRLTWKDTDYPYNYQEPYTKYDLSAKYTHPDGKWSLSAYVRNLTDYADKRTYFGAPISESRLGPPRTYGAVLSMRY